MIHIAVLTGEIRENQTLKMTTACGTSLEYSHSVKYVHSPDAFLTEYTAEEQCPQCREKVPGGLKIGHTMGIL